MLDRLSSVCRLTAAEWGVALHVAMHSAVLLPLAVLAVRCLRLERALRVVAAVPLPWLVSTPPPVGLTAHIADRVTTRLGGGCLPRAIVLQALLARHGAAAVVVIGARRAGRRLHAHAWVEHDGLVLSVDGANGYLPLCRVGDVRTTPMEAA